MANFTYSDEGFALTKSFEGLRLEAYADQGGVWTVGCGHTGPDVHPGLTLTEEEAATLLACDVAAAVTGVNRLVTVRLTQCQFDALVDFAFNLGVGVLARSTLLRFVNRGDFASAAAQFAEWDHCRGVIVPGLLRRRQAEAKMFLGPA